MKIENFESLSVVHKKNYNNENKSKIENKESEIKTQPNNSLQQENKSSKKEELAEDVKESVEDINDIVEKVKEDLSFKIHDKTERLMVQIVDRSTKEVIKELPPEEMLDLAARIHEMVGLLIDEKV